MPSEAYVRICRLMLGIGVGGSVLGFGNTVVHARCF